MNVVGLLFVVYSLLPRVVQSFAAMPVLPLVTGVVIDVVDNVVDVLEPELLKLFDVIGFGEVAVVAYCWDVASIEVESAALERKRRPTPRPTPSPMAKQTRIVEIADNSHSR